MPWRTSHEKLPSGPLCFALFSNDGKVRPHPPIERGLKMTVDALLKAGQKVIPWTPPDHAEAWSIHVEFLKSDGGLDVWSQLNLSHEPLMPGLDDFLGTGPVAPESVLDYQANSLRRGNYLERYMRYWNSTKLLTGTGRVVDAVLLPTAPHAAVIPGKFYHCGYADFIDLLDYTAITFPVTKADAKLDAVDTDYKPMNDLDKKNWEAYDAEMYDGAPVGLQLMGRRFDEERLISITQKVLDALSPGGLGTTI